MSPPATLDRAGIAARIPHQNRMCLLDGLLAWSAEQIECRASSHAEADNPLRGPQGLDSVCAIEYAAQAMALHGALCAQPGSAPQAGFLASARQVKLHRLRLDDAPSPLSVKARILAGDSRQALYQFTLRDAAGQLLVEGRATVVLDTPLIPSP